VEPLGESEVLAQEAATLLIRTGISGAPTLTTVMEKGGRIRVEPATRDSELEVMATSEADSLVASIEEAVRVLMVAAPTGALRPAKFTGRALVRLRFKRITLSFVPSV